MTEPERPLRRPTASGGAAIARWLPVALYCAFIFGLSAIPNVQRLPGGISDKEGHALLYAGLGYLVARALRARFHVWWPVIVVVAVTAYGVSDEVHQLFVPGRQFEVGDMLADAVGGALGAAAFWLWGIIARTTWARPR